MKRPDSSTISIIVCFLIIVALTFSLLFVLNERNSAETVDVSPLQDLAETIQSQYYFYDDKKLDNDKLVDSAMRGMIESLDDPYAQYYTEEEYNNLLTSNSGDYVGLGISVQTPDDAGSMIISVYTGGPADLAGLKKGDIITKVNGTATANLSLDALIACFSDEDDVPDQITYLRDGVETTVEIQRTEVHINRVTSTVYSGNIGYIHITEFNGSVASDFISAAEALQEQGIKNLIIDLRDNPGGVLASAVSVASLFMTDTDVVQVKGRQSDSRTLSTQGAALLEALPVVVLQNRYSASAAEVLASSLQAQKRATILGEVSYGKGSVQSVIPLNDEQAVKLTVANYMTALGKKIDGVGVEPDVTLLGNESTWEQQALDLLRQQALPSGIRFVRKAQADSSAKQDKSIKDETIKKKVTQNNTVIDHVIDKPTAKDKR